MNCRILLSLAVMLVPSPLHAEQGRPDTGTPDAGDADRAVAPACDEPDPRDCPHSELALIPMFGVSSDTGVALGAFVQVARFERGARPYAALLQVQGSLSIFKGSDGLELPFHDDYVLLDLPAFPAEADRLLLNVGYARLTREGYYGVGNRSAATAPPGIPDADLYSSYLREQLHARATLHRRVGSSGLRLYLGVAVARLALTPYASSRLAEDVASGQAALGIGRFWQSAASLGVLVDRRDHEVYPTRGVYGDVELRVAPDGLNAHDFVGIAATGRIYVPLMEERLVLAARILGDVLFGDPPLNELGRFGGVLGNPGPGVATGVRGVPLGRFIGKTKVIGNAELRSLFLPFRAFGQRMVLGCAAFADAGRVWTRSFARDPARDGTGLGLHAGFGGGPRLRWGDAFLLRVDVALAPGADDSGRGTALGVYVTGDAGF
jgi:hypothetical protein